MKWDELGKLIGAAAGVVTLLFGLFSSVLAELVPPVEAMSPGAITGMASVVALVILFVLVLTLQRRPQVAQRQRIAVLAGVAALAGLGLFFVYYGDLDRHSFRWPDSAMSDGQQPTRHLRGNYTPTGLEMTRSMSLTAAIAQAGGLDTARRQQLLWDEDSRKGAELRLVAQYIVLTSLLAGALFGLALAAMFSGRSGGKT